MKTGRKRNIYFALAQYDPLHPKVTKLQGRYASQQQAAFDRESYGGHVVKVTETISWHLVSSIP